MAGGDNLYSQLVFWSKLLLPLFAIALLSTLFLFARDPGAPTAIPLSQIQALARDQQITAPSFSGVTDDGAILAINARSARPLQDRPEAVAITDINMTLNRPDGSMIDVRAIEGLVESSARLLRFEGLAQLETSTGYQMETNGLDVELDTGIVTSHGELEIRAPFGEMTAGQVTFQVVDGTIGQQMLFTEGVHLIYEPPK